MRCFAPIVACLSAGVMGQGKVSPLKIPGIFPPPDYMVDNTNNFHGVAPDKGTLNGPIVNTTAQADLRNQKSNPNLTAVHFTTEYAGDLQARQSSGYWLADIKHGIMPYQQSGYQFYRNVKDFGAKGDGVTDDTIAINLAVSSGNRCGLPENCGSTTISGALVYFPPGTYIVSSPIIQYYYTQFVGDPNNRAVIKGAHDFKGIALIDSDVYIPGGNGAEWYINQNQFYRQIRNLVFDLTAMNDTNQDGDQTFVPTGIHWQVAQATSLQNLQFIMPDPHVGPTSTVGIFMENGSGGFVSDLVFIGGNIGFRAGSQQFTARNLQFFNCGTAISMIWDWGFTWKSITFTNCFVAIDCSAMGQGPDAQGTGSITLLDSSIVAVPFAIPVNPNFIPNFVMDNVQIQNVDFLVFQPGSTNYLEGQPGPITIQSWAMGKRYTSIDGEGGSVIGFVSPVPDKSPLLLDANGKFFERGKPQYESFGVVSFLVATDFGISNDGTGDQSGAINSFLAGNVGRFIFFPAGVYRVESTVFVPAGSVLIGEAWSQIMGAGPHFQDESNPQVVVRFGNVGDRGVMEVTDLLFTVEGPAPGAILVEWNVAQGSQGQAGMWDCHFRVGGAIGSKMQLDNCAKLSGQIKDECKGAYMLMHITERASGYFENVWMWTADHDLDNQPAGTNTTGAGQIDIYTGRGLLVESQGPVWLYGTASEHNIFYQYQFSGASNIYSGHMQTETPYFQPSPNALQVYTSTPSDLSFADCDDDVHCVEAYALRVLNSTNIYIYGAGFYSFFDSYTQDCVATETCQNRIVETSFSEGIWLYDLYTKGSIQAVSPAGGVPAPVLQSDDGLQHGFTTEISVWLPLALEGAAQLGAGPDGAGGGGIVFVDPSIWNETNPAAACSPPCQIILPPLQLPTATTISFPPYSTSITEICDDGGLTVHSTVISIPPVTATEIDYWNVNVTTAPTTVVAESSIQQTPFAITQACNGMTTTFIPPPFPLQTSDATRNNPTVTITSGPPGPTCTSDCGTKCHLFCDGPCLLCAACIPCLPGGGGPPGPPPGFPGGPGGVGGIEPCETITASQCHTVCNPTPTRSCSSTCSSVLSCNPDGSDATETAAPMVSAPFEDWSPPDTDAADATSVGDDMGGFLSSFYGPFPPPTATTTGGGTGPTGTPSLGITLYWVNQLVNGQNLTDYVMQFQSNPCDRNPNTLFEQTNVPGSPQPNQVPVGTFGFDLPPGGFPCSYNNGDPAGPGNVICTEGTGIIVQHPCFRAPSGSEGTCGVTGVLVTHYVAQVVC
ncbi:glycoside hydrolase family 55 protein [Achaetomium macrosporum]|uniref:Glycoside hydrolase family 55 protein n=1 Tax=Achaetomium macrosporum TaxID=79813 RepID=A0AAN7C1H3_9PEZI|nr:glycoside hydrolase family 55 protein [Achaetomium macrosporum]